MAHLAEVDARNLAARDGYSSLHAYCSGLGMSDQEAYERIHAARVVRRFPLALDLLLQGSVTLTALTTLAPHLTADNHRAVLESAQGKTKFQVKELVAALAPRPDLPTVVRRLPAARSSAPPAAPVAACVAPAATTALLAPSPPPPRPTVVEPLAPERYKFETTMDAEARELFALVSDLLGPGASGCDVIKKALAIAAHELTRQKFATTDRPRAGRSEGDPKSRYVPAAVKRTVWLRDRGRCAYVSPGGRRCNSRRELQFHHVKPFEAGGETTVSNLRLACRLHNQHEADVYFDRARREATLEQMWFGAQAGSDARAGT